MFNAKAAELKATDDEIALALDDAGGDYETAMQYLTKRASERTIKNGRRSMGRDDSGL